MLKIAVCEDTRADASLILETLDKYLHNHNLDGEVSYFESGDAFLEVFEPGVYNIIFLDIYMGELGGIKTAKRIRETDNDAAIIFLTVSIEFAMEGYAVRAVHYLQKPITYSALCEAMERCREILNEHSLSLEVTSGRVPVKILMRDILYIEAMQRNRVIYTAEGEVKTSLTMDELDRLVGVSTLIRCHRGFIVNMSKIHRLLEKELVLVNGARIPIGRTYSESFRKRYTSFAMTLARPQRLGEK